jgi:5,10-methylenetetrahydromethanopterin reductase
MQISCGLAPGLDSVELAIEAEQLGYERVWLYDSPAFYADIWVTMARIAERTERIQLGTAVLIPSLRHVLAQASAIATIEALAPGRVAVAIGTGFTGRYTLGQRALKWREVEEYIRQLKALLRGEAVEVDGAKVQMLGPEPFLPERPVNVPIVVAANGPMGTKVATELGDGIMAITTPNPDFEWCSMLVFGTVLDDGEAPDSARALDAAGPALGAMYHAIYEGAPEAVDGLPGGAEWRAAIEAIPEDIRHLATHEDHLIRLNDRDRAVVDPSLLPALTWTGTRDELAARIKTMEAAGTTEILYGCSGPDRARELRAWAEMAGIAPSG